MSLLPLFFTWDYLIQFISKVKLKFGPRSQMRIKAPNLAFVRDGFRAYSVIMVTRFKLEIFEDDYVLSDVKITSVKKQKITNTS